MILLGTLAFSGHGGSSAQSAMDTTAAGDIWNNTLGITGKPAAASAGNDSLSLHTSISNGWFSCNSFNVSRDRAAQETHTSYGLSFTGVEGLTLNYAYGDSGVPAAVVESTTMHGCLCLGFFLSCCYSLTEADKTRAANMTSRFISVSLHCK